MFGKLLRKLLGESAPPVAPKPSIGIEAKTDSGPQAFLHKEPILGRDYKIHGYTLHIEKPRMGRARHQAAQQFIDNALLDMLGTGAMEALQGRRQVFLLLAPSALLLPQLDHAQRGDIVLHPSGDVSTLEQPEPLIERAKQLKALGYKLACPASFTGTPLQPLLHEAAYISLDVHDLAPTDILETHRHVSVHYPDVPQIAVNVTTEEMLTACRKMGITLFSGSLITEQRRWSAPRKDTSRAVVIQLMGQLRSNQEDFKQLALSARLDPVLAFRLLRYVNSAAMGLRYKIASLERAMAYVGREGLYRWLSLLLFHTGQNEPMDDALREVALARGRLTELLALHKLGRAEGEMAFVTGLLSVVDILFRTPMEQAIAQLGLPQEVSDALLKREGRLGTFLGLAIACEKEDQQAIRQLAAESGLDAALVSAHHLEALVWALEFTDSLHRGTLGEAG